ncbi:MAG TPA: hypothetical protein VLX30_08780 [Burkholderiales bacterium]|nr:hypothetical protein [Burkholderiales bacterium]
MNPAPFLGIMTLFSIAPSAFVAGEAGREPEARITSLRQLRREVERWESRNHRRCNKQDVDDLVGWLNRNFYKFDA